MEFTKLDYKGFEEWLVYKSELKNRLHYHFWFDNDYGASVAKLRINGISATYGAAYDLFEVAVLYKGEIVYNTPIADDVIGHCTQEEVIKLLERIRTL